MPRIITLLRLHLSSCFCASLLYLVCPLKKPQSFALLSLQLLSSTSTLALYTTDCTSTFGPLSDWPQIALRPLHAVFNNTRLWALELQIEPNIKIVIHQCAFLSVQHFYLSPLSP